MASFYAELHLAGAVYRVIHCHFASEQPTDVRGRVQAKVRYAPLQLVLDVPDDGVLLDWAAAPYKPLGGAVVFYDTARQTAYESITFTAGECIHYGEQFVSGASGDGAYVCRLTIAAPKFELLAGGPSSGTAAISALEMPTADNISQKALSTPIAVSKTPGIIIHNAGEGDVRPAQFVREIVKGEKIADIVAECKRETFLDGVEYAVIKGADNKRVIVSGGSKGIELPHDTKIIFGHTHPPVRKGAINDPSEADRVALEILKQPKQYVYHDGQRTTLYQNGDKVTKSDYE